MFLIYIFSFLSLFNNQPVGLNPGDKAADFQLKNIDGKMIGFSNYKDAKGFIVIFTCNHCPFSVAYEERIIDLAKKYSPLGYQLIAINPNDPEVVEEDSYAEMQERAKKMKFNFPYLFDEGQKVFPLYGATKTPHVFLLDKNLIVKYIGAIDDSARNPSEVKVKYLEDAITAVDQGKVPNPSITKAIGCSIKVKK
ncbi:MAG: thioredoxin family protein [Saprospiraceae bacterium]|nr:thioredoxin family protein [Saprospiraceae bacterium]